MKLTQYTALAFITLATCTQNLHAANPKVSMI